MTTVVRFEKRWLHVRAHYVAKLKVFGQNQRRAASSIAMHVSRSSCRSGRSLNGDPPPV
jgi:hypothetical protein